MAARFTLEPQLRDIFVEGHFDQEVLTRALHENKVMDRVVYEIDSVEVPDTLLMQHRLTTGNKQRVIVLARELASMPPENAFRCLIDRDLDHWFGPLETTARLAWTDFTALELYFFNDAVLQDVLITTAKCQIANWDGFRNSMIEVLRTIYLLRLADRELDLKLKWLSIDRCLMLHSGRVVFNQAEYVKRVLMHNNHNNLAANYKTSINQWHHKVSGDPRLYIHGHDLVEMLAWTIKKNKGLREFASIDAITRILVLISVRASDVIQRL